MNWLRRVLGLSRPEPNVAKPSTDELREATELRTENKRHVEAIERHVQSVSNRVRTDTEQADRRVRGR